MSAGRELTFVVFMMHILAAAWSMSPSEAYALCKRSGALDKYLVPHYDVLHSMGANALIEDITGYIRERDMCEVKYNVTIDTYKERLEERIIAYLSEMKGISIEAAMDVYYRSRLATQIANGLYGIENMDYKYLAEDLVENEPELFNP